MAINSLENCWIASHRPALALMFPKGPKIRREGQAGVTDTLHPIPHPVSPNIDPLCANVWGSVLQGGVLRVRRVCLGAYMLLKQVA